MKNELFQLTDMAWGLNLINCEHARCERLFGVKFHEISREISENGAEISEIRFDYGG